MNPKRRRGNFIRWIDRKGAINFIVTEIRKGKSFAQAFRDMEKVASIKRFIGKNKSLELMSIEAYTRLKNECDRQLQEIEQNDGA